MSPGSILPRGGGNRPGPFPPPLRTAGTPPGAPHRPALGRERCGNTHDPEPFHLEPAAFFGSPLPAPCPTFPVSRPGTTAALLRSLGNPPFWRGE